MSASATFVDPQGYTPLHWAAGPEDNMAGDTQERRSCLEMPALPAGGRRRALDHTELQMRAVTHAAAHNLAGCVHPRPPGADLSGVTLGASTAAPTACCGRCSRCNAKTATASAGLALPALPRRAPLPPSRRP